MSAKDPSTSLPGVAVREVLDEELALDSLSLCADSTTYGSISPPGKEPQTVTTSQLYVISFSIYLAIYLAAVDTTVVATIMTVMASELDSMSSISWIGTSYLLSSSAFQPLWGKLSDIFGRKPLLILCCVIFSAGCYICVTDLLVILVTGRFITGIGGSGLLSVGSITFTDIVPLRSRGIYQGLGNIAFGLGAASGGALGGYVADSLGWRYVFMLQIPLAILVAVSLVLFLNLPPGLPGLGSMGHSFTKKLKRVDFVGSALLVLALVAILLAASLGGHDFAYVSWQFGTLFFGSIVLFGIFGWWENSFAAEPTIPIHLLLDRTVLATCMTTWFYTISVLTYMFYVPIYFTSVMKLSASQNGARLVPNFFAVALGSLLAGFYMKKTGKYYNMMMLVNVLAIIGVLRMITITPQISQFEQFTLFLPSGFAYAAALTVTLLSLIAAVPSSYQAATTSIQYTFRATGSTLGVAIGSAIFQRIVSDQLNANIHALLPEDPSLAEKIIEKALENVTAIEKYSKNIQNVVSAAYDLACKGALVFSFISICIGCSFSIMIREHQLHTSLDRK